MHLHCCRLCFNRPVDRRGSQRHTWTSRSRSSATRCWARAPRARSTSSPRPSMVGSMRSRGCPCPPKTSSKRPSSRPSCTVCSSATLSWDTGTRGSSGVVVATELCIPARPGRPRAVAGAPQSPPTTAECHAWSRSLLDALQAVHDQRVIHRDLSPWNVFVSRGPDGLRQLRLGDFGMAAQLPDGKQLSGLEQDGCPPLDDSALGSPFSAPELGATEGCEYRTAPHAACHAPRACNHPASLILPSAGADALPRRRLLGGPDVVRHLGRVPRGDEQGHGSGRSSGRGGQVGRGL